MALADTRPSLSGHIKWPLQLFEIIIIIISIIKEICWKETSRKKVWSMGLWSVSLSFYFPFPVNEWDIPAPTPPSNFPHSREFRIRWKYCKLLQIKRETSSAPNFPEHIPELSRKEVNRCVLLGLRWIFHERRTVCARFRSFRTGSKDRVDSTSPLLSSPLIPVS